MTVPVKFGEYIKAMHLKLVKPRMLENWAKLYNILGKTKGLLGKFNNCLPRSSLTTIYKSFVEPHLDYGDVIFDKD